MRSKKTVSDAEVVEQFMTELNHPLKAEMEAVRSIIREADSRILERIKWKGPSYYCREDFVTFNPRATKWVHLVFHHPAIINIKSQLLEGDYKDRRMVYFTDMRDIESKKTELQRIIKELII